MASSFGAAGYDGTPLRSLQRDDTIAGTRGGNSVRQTAFQDALSFSGDFMRSCLLWLIGVPIPIIILLWLITGHA
ncbi:MAG TPA: hypothetical protein VKR31_06940 [Rhizomicrobium sp.]|nr:hypothetical protein [Rhizomicrobium sp.]